MFDATANVPGTFDDPFLDGFFPDIPQVFPFDPGSYTFSVTFTPTDTADYNTATASVTFNVDPAAPTVTWADPAAIVSGTALGAAQLDATADVPGTFAYSPAAGTVLGAGSHTLSVAGQGVAHLRATP
jgi:hypothetical protein